MNTLIHILSIIGGVLFVAGLVKAVAMALEPFRCQPKEDEHFDIYG